MDTVTKCVCRLNMRNEQHVRVNEVIKNLNSDIYKSRNQFIIDAIDYYIEHYGREELMANKSKNTKKYVEVSQLEAIKEDICKCAIDMVKDEMLKTFGTFMVGTHIGERTELKRDSDTLYDTKDADRIREEVADVAQSYMDF